MEVLIYEDTPRYDFWLKFILAGVLAVLFIVAVILLFKDVIGALVMFGATIFDALLLKSILPRRFQIFQDKLKIVMGGPFAMNISFSNIKEVRRAAGSKTFAYGGIRFATSTRYVVEIVRKKGMSVIFSPNSGEVFLEQLNQAIKAKTP